MTCSTCGGTVLAEISFTDHPVAVATVCLHCGAVQPASQDVEQS